MPEYSYFCKECEESFSVVLSVASYEPKQPCPRCGYPRAERALEDDWASLTGGVKLGDEQIKLGHLAKRNSERMSDDEKAHLTYEHNKYRFEGYEEAEERLGRPLYGPKGKREPHQPLNKKRIKRPINERKKTT